MAHATLGNVLSRQEELAANDYHRAIAACEWMLEVGPLLEQVHCDLMRF